MGFRKHLLAHTDKMSFFKKKILEYFFGFILIEISRVWAQMIFQSCLTKSQNANSNNKAIHC